MVAGLAVVGAAAFGGVYLMNTSHAEPTAASSPSTVVNIPSTIEIPSLTTDQDDPASPVIVNNPAPSVRVFTPSAPRQVGTPAPVQSQTPVQGQTPAQGQTPVQGQTPANGTKPADEKKDEPKKDEPKKDEPKKTTEDGRRRTSRRRTSRKKEEPKVGDVIGEVIQAGPGALDVAAGVQK